MPLCQPSGRSSNVSAGPRRGAASSAEGEGFEPPGPRGLARFQDGCLIHFSQPSTSALSRGRTCNNVFLRHAPLPVGLPEHRTRQSMDAGGNRTLISWVQTRGLPVRRRAHELRCQRCGKGSNLQPRPSEGRALIRLSYRNDFRARGGKRLSLAHPDATDIQHSALPSHAPGRTRTCNRPVKSRRLCR